MPPNPPADRPTTTGPGNALERGSGPGLAVVLHAAGSSPRALATFATGLAEHFGRVTVPALAAGAASLVQPGPAPFAAAVALVRDLVQRDGAVGSRLLVGHSMGGLVALLALAEGVEADAVVLYEPIVLGLLDRADAGDRAALDWDADCIQRFAERCAAGDPEAGVAGFMEAYGEVPWHALPAPVRADLVARAPSLLVEAKATNAAHIDSGRLRRLAMPVLLLDGRRSPEIAGRMTTRLADVLPNAQRITIEGVGHMGPVAAPVAVTGAITGFLRRRGLGTLP